jgi:hypothetical protein
VIQADRLQADKHAALLFCSSQTTSLHDMAQRLLTFGMLDIGRLMGVVAVGGAKDKGFYSKP